MPTRWATWTGCWPGWTPCHRRSPRQRAARKAERAKQSAEAKAAKEKFVEEAERLAAGNDWRGGVNRFRSLLDQWKELPRLDRATDDELWHRFSSARTTYTRRRKAQFAQQNEERESARAIKERLAAEAETHAQSTDWGPTTGIYRDLMNRGKRPDPRPAASTSRCGSASAPPRTPSSTPSRPPCPSRTRSSGPTPRPRRSCWSRPRRSCPITDLAAAKAAYRDVIERWAAIGKVPRDSIRPLENRLNAIETAIKDAEDEQWQRTNPEARARAEETAAKLEAQIAELEAKAAKAEARGDAKAARKAADSAATYREWLVQAQRAVADFSG